MLAGCHIWRAAHYLGGLAVAKVHGGYVQVVAVRVFYACEHMAHYKSFQPSAYAFHLLYGAHLQTYGSQGCGQFIRSKCKVNISLEPVIGYIHSCLFFNGAKLQRITHIGKSFYYYPSGMVSAHYHIQSFGYGILVCASGYCFFHPCKAVHAVNSHFCCVVA